VQPVGASLDWFTHFLLELEKVSFNGNEATGSSLHQKNAHSQWRNIEGTVPNYPGTLYVVKFVRRNIRKDPILVAYENVF
jgi:hypothetical protein